MLAGSPIRGDLQTHLTVTRAAKQRLRLTASRRTPPSSDNEPSVHATHFRPASSPVRRLSESLGLQRDDDLAACASRCEGVEAFCSILERQRLLDVDAQPAAVDLIAERRERL